MLVDFDTLKPESRSVILVASDKKYEELRKQCNWKDILQAIPEHYLYWWIGGPFGLIYKLWQDKDKAHEIPFPHLPPKDAVRRFKFDLGHPQDSTAYVLNPCSINQYLLPTLANERFVQEKVAAFLEISAALGAKKLELLSGSLDSASASSQVNLRTVAAQAGLSASFSNDYSINRQVFMEFSQPLHPPRLPAELEAWLTQDPLLRALVNTRLRQQLHKAKISLKLSESVNLAAEISTMLRGVGINIGGEYKHVYSSTWDFDIEFWTWSEQKNTTEEEQI